jgi:hypothetical protein
MLYSTNQADIDTHYISKVTLRQALSTFQVTFPRLYDSHSYNVSTFIIDENGLPFPQAGTSSRVIQLTPSTGIICGKISNYYSIEYHKLNPFHYPDTPRNYQQPLISVDLITDPDRNESCIQCIFLEESISSCVAIIHKSASFLSSTNGLLAIDVVKIDRELNNSVASHCLKPERLNLTNHVVTIFSYNGSIIIEPAIVLKKNNGGGKCHQTQQIKPCMHVFDVLINLILTYNCTGESVSSIKIDIVLLTGDNLKIKCKFMVIT